MELNLQVDAIAAQEAALIFDRFDEAVAWQIGSLVRDRALVGSWPVVVDVSLFHRPLFFAALPGSAPDNDEWVRRKRNVVARFHKSSYRVGREMALKSDSLVERFGIPASDFAEHGGAFPITLRVIGVIGAVTVSGLAQREDHKAVVSGLCAVLGQDERTLAFTD